MIEFVTRWHLYGGGPASEIFVDFGISEREFFARTLRLLATDYTASHVDAATAGRLREVCRRRLKTPDRFIAAPS
ncbi:hypothetical protein [Mycolicibacterium hippocampi]|nr:hypothetical protein [Mycolicibacterium hippocampi]